MSELERMHMNGLVRGIQGLALALAWMSASMCAHADTILSTSSTIETTVIPFSGAAAITDQQYLAFSFSLGNPYRHVFRHRRLPRPKRIHSINRPVVGSGDILHDLLLAFL